MMLRMRESYGEHREFSQRSLPTSHRFGRLVEQSQTAAVGLLQILSSKHDVRRATRNDSHVQQHDRIEVFRDCVQIMMNHNGCFASLLHLPQNLDDGFFRRCVNCSKWFVHKIKIGVLHQGSSQKSALLLATGQLTDLSMRKFADPDCSRAC